MILRCGPPEPPLRHLRHPLRVRVAVVHGLRRSFRLEQLGRARGGEPGPGGRGRGAAVVAAAREAERLRLPLAPVDRDAAPQPVLHPAPPAPLGVDALRRPDLPQPLLPLLLQLLLVEPLLEKGGAEDILPLS